MLKTPSPIPPFSPKNAKALLLGVKALPLRAEALLLHPKAMLLHHPLASPENTGLTRRLNTPFSLHRPPFFCNFAYRKRTEKDPLQSPCLGGWYQLKESWLPNFSKSALTTIKQQTKFINYGSTEEWRSTEEDSELCQWSFNPSQSPRFRGAETPEHLMERKKDMCPCFSGKMKKTCGNIRRPQWECCNFAAKNHNLNTCHQLSIPFPSPLGTNKEGRVDNDTPLEGI